MLELVSSNEERFLLERSNLSLDKVCSLNLDIEEKWLCLGNITQIKGEKNLIKKLKKYQEFRIWYSSINTEELNNYYYLVNRIFTNIKNSTIYIVNPTNYKKEIYSIIASSKETVENLVNY